MADWTFPVLDNHPAMSRRYCECCGAEVDGRGECLGEVNDHGEACKAINKLTRWALHDLTLLRVISYRIHTPGMTVRDLARSLGIGKSQADYHLRRAAIIMPRLKVLLMQTKPGVIAQGARRKTEKQTKKGRAKV